MRTTIQLVIAFALILSVGCTRSAPEKPSDIDYYTCTMHPSVHAEAPGKCPICSMDLVPVLKKSETAHGRKGESAHEHDAANETSPTRPLADSPIHEFTVPVERQQQIGVTYATVERTPLQHVIRAVGVIAPDAERRWSFVARVEGYVQQLFVTSPGEKVEKNAPLLSIYSPELLTTERELVMLLQMRDRARTPALRATPEQLIAAAKARLAQWNMTAEQITELERTRQPNELLTLRSPFRGIVQQVPVKQGMSVKAGDPLVEVADLSLVWVWGDFYQSELPMLQRGQKVTVTTSSYPNEKFEGTIGLIDPFIDPTRRTARARIDIPNRDFRLQPGMYANLEWAMQMGEGLVIPVSAVMPTGIRNIAFVDKGSGKLEPRVVELGETFGNFYEVKSGLTKGERVVASANFLIDAESKVQGALKDFEGEGMGETANRRMGENPKE
jgi:membrane fusion protein, copper/silver efflux system